jgi:hypothetical protein
MNAPESQVETSGHDHSEGTCCGGHAAHDHGSHSHEHHSHEHHSHQHDDPNDKFFMVLESLALAVWGGVLVYYVSSGKVIPFLSTTGIFREQALIGGYALIVLALFNFLMRNRFPGCGHDHSADGADGGHHHHHHEQGSWLSRLITIFILVAPVGLSAAYAPPDWTDEFKATQANSLMAANAPAAGNASAAMVKKDSGSTGGAAQKFTLEDFKKYCPPNDQGQFPLSVSDLWSAAGDPDLRRVMTGQTAVVTSQVVADNFGKDGTTLRVFELQMTCCAADARPVSFPIAFDGPKPDYRESGWYKVTGTVSFKEEARGTITTLHVTEMTPTTKPRQNGGPAL